MVSDLTTTERNAMKHLPSALGERFVLASRKLRTENTDEALAEFRALVEEMHEMHANQQLAFNLESLADQLRGSK